MITGENGFIRRFADKGGFDQDVLTEYFMTISAIHGVVTQELDDSLVFSVRVDNDLCPFFTFADSLCFIDTCRLSEFMEKHNRSARTFLADISPQNDYLPIPEHTEDFDSTILAIYRFVHE